MKGYLSHLRFVFFALIYCSLLSACTRQYSGVVSTLKEGFLGFDDVSMSTNEVQALPYASCYMRFDNAQRIFMVLAYAEPNPKTGLTQLKWFTSDGAMVVTEQGRVVKTVNLPGKNLERRQSHPQSWEQNRTIAVRYDWPQHLYGITARATLFAQGSEEITSLLWKQRLTIWREEVDFDNSSEKINNLYWVDKQGQVLKSVQYVGPDMMKVEFEILKPYMEVSHAK